MPPAGRSRTPRITSSCFASVIRAYLDSGKFKSYSEATQALWGLQLRLAERPEILGALAVDEVRPALVQAFLDGLIDRPAKQAAAYTAIKQLEKWAIVRDLLAFPITTGCEVEGSDGGHVPWNDDHVALGERSARRELARVITLAANTGQRSSDLVRMRWTDIEHYDGRPGINVVQKKTGVKIWVPFTQPIIAALATWERQPGFILLSPKGEPWRRKALTSAWTYQRDTNESLKPLADAGLVLHGLRGTACVRLSRAGANTRQIADMIGMSEEMVKSYTRLSEQKDNAMAAVLHLDRTRREPDKVPRKQNR